MAKAVHGQAQAEISVILEYCLVFKLNWKSYNKMSRGSFLTAGIYGKQTSRLTASDQQRCQRYGLTCSSAHSQNLCAFPLPPSASVFVAATRSSRIREILPH